MNSRAASIRRFLLCPSAWLLAGATLAATGWLGRATIEGRVIAGVVTAVVFYSISMREVVRRGARIRGAAARVVRPAPAAGSAELATLKALVDDLPGVAWRSGTACDRTWFAPTWAELTGQAVDDALDEGWLDAVHADDRNRVRSAQHLAAHDEAMLEVDYRLRGADGEYRWVTDHAAPCLSDDVLTGYVGITVETAVAGDAEPVCPERVGRLLQLNERINAQAFELVGRYENLEEEKRHTEYCDRIKSEYLAALADDLRTPCEELENIGELVSTLPPGDEHSPHFDRVRLAATMLRRCIDRAQGLGRLTDGADEVEADEFDLRRLVERIGARHEEQVIHRGLTSSCVVEDVVPALVRGDQVKIRHLLMDLWSAGIRLARRGRVTFRVSQKATDKETSILRFAVSFSGGHIPADQLDRAFYPDQALADEATGLGLGPTKRLVELLGGEMGVEHDETSTVTIWAVSGVAEVNPNWEGRRTHGRLSQESVHSNLGTVLDLSLGGMRVRCAAPPEGELEIELSDDQETLDLRAEVAWTRRIGFGKHEAGLRFIDMDRETSARLGCLATRNRMRRVFRAA